MYVLLGSRTVGQLGSYSWGPGNSHAALDSCRNFMLARGLLGLDSGGSLVDGPGVGSKSLVGPLLRPIVGDADAGRTVITLALTGYLAGPGVASLCVLAETPLTVYEALSGAT